MTAPTTVRSKRGKHVHLTGAGDRTRCGLLLKAAIVTPDEPTCPRCMAVL